MNILLGNKVSEVNKPIIKVLGNKSQNLYLLNSQNITIPKSLYIPGEEINDIKKISNIIQKEFRTKIIIRSDSKIEDSIGNSYAGFFESSIATSMEEIESGIKNVLISQKKEIKKIDDIGVLVQEYIETDFSGVYFTYDPSYNIHAGIIEYTKGLTDEVTSGIKKPIKKYLPRTYVDKNLGINLCKINDIGLKSEIILKHPQDIEWGIGLDKKIYILQSRPISTISNIDYKGIKFIDNYESENNSYIFYKNEVSEIFDTPTEFEFSLIKTFLSIYAKGIYKKYNIDFLYNGYLEILGGNLYTNKEKELNSLLKNFTYIGEGKIQKNKNFVFKDSNYLISDIKNLYFLSRIQLSKQNINLIEEDLYEYIYECIKILKKPQKTSFKEFLEYFLNTYYKLIFEINILSGNSKIKNTDKKEYWPKLRSDLISLKLKGNSLSFQDKGEFIISENEPTGVYSLREKGRILSVLCKNIIDILGKKEYGSNYLKYSLKDLSNAKKISKIKEKEIHKLPINICKPLPEYTETKNESIGYKTIGKGILISKEDYEENYKVFKNKNIILFSRYLDPKISRYLNKLNGIICENGGELSHLSIIARELKKPILRIEYNNGLELLGKNIEINGFSSNIKEIN